VNTLNLSDLPAVTTIEFLQWIIDNKIGNWEELMRFIARYEDWWEKGTIPFECSDEEAILIILRWS
jgi:hypothetical protein